MKVNKMLLYDNVFVISKDVHRNINNTDNNQVNDF